MMTTWWSVVTEVSGRHVGAVFGLANSLAIPGGVAGPLFMGFFVEVMAGRGYQGRDQWDPAFYAYAGVVLAGAVGWLFIDATRSVVTPPQPSTPAGMAPPQVSSGIGPRGKPRTGRASQPCSAD
jgi:hypothetical protein